MAEIAALAALARKDGWRVAEIAALAALARKDGWRVAEIAALASLARKDGLVRGDAASPAPRKGGFSRRTWYENDYVAAVRSGLANTVP